MSVLVTGATGFLGSALMTRLIAHGHRDIRCFVRPSSDCSGLNALQDLHPDVSITRVCGNLADRRDIVRALDGVDTLYHLAAGMRGSMADIVMNSVVASRNLLDAAATAGVPHIVLISSFSVYGVADLPRGGVLNEDTPLEPHPELRDFYAFGKLRQEKLFHEYQERYGFRLTILRPGVIYGPDRPSISNRVGLQLPGLFLQCGGGNSLPLSYVDNCAEAIVMAAAADTDRGVDIYNVLDDDLPSCRKYLRMYRRRARNLRTIPVPYFAMMALSRLCRWYHNYSRGQLPAFLTPYKAASLWKGNRFDNRKLKSIGWRQIISTEEGLTRSLTPTAATP